MMSLFKNKTLNGALAYLHILLLGLMAGFFFAFSVDVMPALDSLEPAVAISAMNAINEAVRNPVFFITFFLTPIIGLAASGLFYKVGETSAALFSLAALLVYGFLAFLPTVLINVPMNEALAALNITSQTADIDQNWIDYSERWAFWNTVRTATTCLAFLLSAISLRSLTSK